MRLVSLKSTLAMIALAALCAACAAGPAGRSADAHEGALHVASPDWRDQIVYFVVTDRFADGDPANNDQGAGEYDPSQRSRFSGGDLAGLRQRLDYIKGLGATAVWLTPPVKNQWLDHSVGYGGYHGYWTSHFKEVDPHFGTLGDYQALSRALHSRGMYLIQDIVLNHTANFFHYGDGFTPGAPERGYQTNAGSRPMQRPEQAPFDRNDPRRKQDRDAAIYYWTPPASDLSDRRQELTYQLSGLDDLNTQNPVVRTALRESYGFWIREAGVDAFRVDTAFYVEPELFTDFMYSTESQAPGMESVARATGRNAFHVFGEGFGVDRPFDDKMARKIDAYMRGPAGERRAPGMLNFPLYGSLTDAFARGRAPAELGYRIQSMMSVHANPHLMPTFIDNHDVDRFLASGSPAGLKQALFAMMTLPGIPVIYYGAEQGFTDQRAAMFATGWGSRGRDWYDQQSPMYRAIADMTSLRKANRVFSRGAPRILYAHASGPGALVFVMQDGEDVALIALNTSDRAVLAANVETGLAEGAPLVPLYAIEGVAPNLSLAKDAILSVSLPARAGMAWRVGKASPGAVVRASSAPTLDPIADRITGADVTVSGRAAPGETVWLIANGDISTPTIAMAGRDGRFSAKLSIASMIDPAIRNTLVAQAQSSGAVSATRSFFVAQTWSLAAQQNDPLGDDKGPSGRYVYPTDPTFAMRTMDIRAMQVETAGGSLRLTFTMAALSQVWNPQNGFDHLALSVFIDVPTVGPGQTVMPLQQARTPAGFAWDYRLRLHGWSNALFTAAGASDAAEGAPSQRAADIAVDAQANTITLTIPADALGGAGSLAGAQIYATTWDYDGGFRALAGESGPFVFGGGLPSDPKIIDAIGPIRLKL